MCATGPPKDVQPSRRKIKKMLKAGLLFFIVEFSGNSPSAPAAVLSFFDSVVRQHSLVRAGFELDQIGVRPMGHG
jgi:hypothetical protein